MEIASPNVGTDGRPLPGALAASGQPRFQAFANGSLLIPDFGKLEEGTYSCLATNELGSAESSVNVALATPGEGRGCSGAQVPWQNSGGQGLLYG